MLLSLMAAVSVAASLLICVTTGSFAGLDWIWMLPLLAVGFLLLGIVLAFLFLLILASAVDLRKEQKEDSKLYRKTIELYLESALPPLRWHITTKGMEKVPERGRFLLVCNHCNNADPIILLYCLKKFQLAFISKRENSTMFVIGPMMHKILCQLINRENDREALKTILRCIQIIKEDKASIAVFPEGGILSEDGKLHHFRPGVFKIAQKANVPIVVCTLKNTKDVVNNIYHFKPSYVEMKVLEVIPAEELKGVTTVDIAHRCYDLMAADLGPDLIAED